MMIFRKKPSPPAIDYIVAGLGNPGEKYTFTRHNAGFLTLDFVSEKLGFKINEIKFNSFVKRVKITGSEGAVKQILFMKPQTYMNNSGAAVAAAARYYRVAPENILVVFDDISLPPGRLRIRRNGSDGGHNGIKSLICHLKSDAFPRIKIGVGEKPHPDYDLADWVTSKFSASEQKPVFDAFARAADAIEFIAGGGTADAAMNKFNRNL